MTVEPSLEEMARTVRELYRANPGGAREAIEAYLRSSLEDMGGDRRKSFVRRLQAGFSPTTEPKGSAESTGASGRLSELVWGILGDNATPTGRSQVESIEALADALNSIFDHLNSLVALIHLSLIHI